MNTGHPYSVFRYIENPWTTALHIFKPSETRARSFFARFEKQGWWAQLKMNGTRSGVYIAPDRTLEAWNRHGERHQVWHFTEQTSTIFHLRGREWNLFDGELLHHKTTHIKNTHYLYDCLVHNGFHLTRTTYAERYRILEKLFRKEDECFGYWVLNNFTWLARNYTSGFYELYQEAATLPGVEGLVLKNPEGVYYTANATAWMVKVRFK